MSRVTQDETTVIREHLRSALYADLVGPFGGVAAHTSSIELLRQRPSNRYLTGFLVPEVDRETQIDEEDSALGTGDDMPSEDSAPEEHEPQQKKLFPASMGMSFLLPAGSTSVTAHVSCGLYFREKIEGDRSTYYRRKPFSGVEVEVPLDAKRLEEGIEVTGLGRVKIEGVVSVLDKDLSEELPAGTVAASIFLVNRRVIDEATSTRDEETLFQVQLSIRSVKPLVERPNRKGEASLDDWDARVAELQYRNNAEFGVGHNVSVEPIESEDGKVYALQTRWMPAAEVPLVDARRPEKVTVEMEALAMLKTEDEIDAALANLSADYQSWIEEVSKASLASKDRSETRDQLMQEARGAAKRIEDGIALLKSDPPVLEAFCLANQAMAMASRQRSPERRTPSWRLFQLAFLLLNIRGVVDPAHADRKTVELIFFPTGGGKTEAYLGVIAFTLLMRRLRGQSEPHRGLGLAVILRYTLRLLTLDQLERATTLICALDLIRREHESDLGSERFCMGLWVGQSASPNTFAQFSERLDAHATGGGLPCPLEKCPWCGHEIKRASLEVRPTKKKPERVVVRCLNQGECDFATSDVADLGIPLVYVDEQLYRELPCFIIATVDKFAMMPWRGEAGMLFGKVNAEKEGRFFGPLHKSPKGGTVLPDGLLPPELIVQDELHLISGPLGTMVGLYETAIETLCTAHGKRPVPPKLLASTATANHARQQIQSLYSRDTVQIFPPPGIDALQTYFSEVNQADPGRLYVGVAAPGQPLKRILIRVYASLLTAAWKAAEDETVDSELRDAYLTLVGYFNALRELGGMRRLVEADVLNLCRRKQDDKPVDSYEGAIPFKNREIHEPLELTSRETTANISKTKNRLANKHAAEKTTDVALASNMISVGVDIERLALMVVAGQPKTTSEYIQASSRVGRKRTWPGLVVTCLNVAKPRDRSHYEHFIAYHESFYRFVEAQSVTPFAQRALQRGLTGAMVSSIRLGVEPLTPSDAATQISEHRKRAEEALAPFLERAGGDATVVRAWAYSRLDAWEKLAKGAISRASQMRYSKLDKDGTGSPLLYTSLDKPTELDPGGEKFCAPTSMRDVEPTTHLWLYQPDQKQREGKKA